MQGILKILDVAEDKLTKQDYDTLVIIDGDEGKGKSNLALHLLDNWYKRINGEITKEDIKFIALSPKEFIGALNKLKRYGMVVYDEAGDLSNLRVMNKLNYRVSLAYQAIRGLNLFTILVIPSLWRLNPYFVYDRCKTYIHVYKRNPDHCRVGIWNRKRLRTMLEINQHRKTKKRWIVRPMLKDIYREYKGILKDGYKDKKIERIKTIRVELDKEFKEDVKKDELLILTEKLKKEYGVIKTAKLLGVTKKTVYDRLKKKAGLAANEGITI